MKKLALIGTWAAIGAVQIGTSPARAQETMASVGAASSMSSSMSSMGPGAAGGQARNRAAGSGSGNGEMDGEGGGSSGGPGGSSGGYGGSSGGEGGGAAAPILQEPQRWSAESGAEILGQLTAGDRQRRRVPNTARARRSSRRQAANVRRVTRMTPQQRSRMVRSRYKIPPRGWLAHYLPADRYKITSKLWRYVSTETDSFYYEPSARAMLQQSPNRVIGFYSWRDAMLAGYRPDPVTKPAPGRQLASLAGYGRGPQLSRFVEFVYAGQVTPEVFDVGFSYIQNVARTTSRYKHTRPLLGQTVEQAIAAVMGEGPPPRNIGGPPRPVGPPQGGGYPGGSGGYPGGGSGGYPGGSGGYPGGSSGSSSGSSGYPGGSSGSSSGGSPGGIQ